MVSQSIDARDHDHDHAVPVCLPVCAVQHRVLSWNAHRREDARPIEPMFRFTGIFGKSFLLPCNKKTRVFAPAPCPRPRLMVCTPRTTVDNNNGNGGDGTQYTSAGVELDLQVGPHCPGHHRPVRRASREERGRTRRRREVSLGPFVVRATTRVQTRSAWRV